MATAKKAVTKKTGTGMVAWDEALAARANMAKKAEESVSTGSFISMKGGQMVYNGNAVPGNALDAVVIDSVLENQFFDGVYDPNTPQTPSCYAFGRDEDDMRPHEKVAEPFAETCAECPNNEFGSADTGRGKACKNVRRLALISADALDGGEQGIEDATVAYLKVPVTSVKGWAGYVNTLAATNKPPLAFVTEVAVVPDAGTQFKVNFKAKESIEDGELIGALLAKADVVEQGIMFPYQPVEAAPAKPARQARAKPARAGRAAPAAPVAGKVPAGKVPAGKPRARKF